RLELERVSRYRLCPEPSAVDPTEQRQLPRVAFVGQDRDPTELRQRLDHEDTWQCRPVWEVAGEERFVTREVPASSCRLARHEFGDLVDEQERGPVGKHVLGAHARQLTRPHPVWS